MAFPKHHLHDTSRCTTGCTKCQTVGPTGKCVYTRRSRLSTCQTRGSSLRHAAREIVNKIACDGTHWVSSNV